MKTQQRKTIEGVPVKHLTARQRLFVERYIIHRNATKAAEEAGYADPNSFGPKLLSHPKVAAVLSRIEKRTTKRNGLEREAVLRRLANNLHRNLMDLVDEDGYVISDIRQIPKRAHAWIDGLKVKQLFSDDGEIVGQIIEFKLSPNASVQDMAMKHIGGYAAEQHEHTVGLDWDALASPPTKPDPIADEIRRLEESKE